MHTRKRWLNVDAGRWTESRPNCLILFETLKAPREGVISYSFPHKRFLTGAGRELLSSSCAAALLAGSGSAALSQEALPLWGSWGELGAQAGSETSAFLEGFMPLAQDGDSMVFLDMRLDYGENNRGSASFGLGIREIVGPDLILGANAFIDTVKTDNNNYKLGMTLGLEAFTSIFDLRLNAHVPLGGSSVTGSATVTNGVAVVNNQLVEQRSQVERTEALLYGLTGEIGAMFDSPFGEKQKLRTYVGGYVYDRGGYRMETGARLGLEYQIHDALGLSGARLTLGAELVYDKDDELDAIASARLRVPLHAGRAEDGEGGGTRLSSIRERMNEGVRRDKGIRVGNRTTSTALANTPVINPTTGRSYGGVYYANATGGGVGSFPDPTSLATAIANAGTDGIVVVLGDGGPIATSGVTLQSGQILTGGGESVAVRLASGATTSFLLSGTNGTIDGDPGVTTVTLADGVTIRNLTLLGGTTVVGGNNVTGVTLSNLSIQDATDGVRITGATGATLSNLSFSGITGTSIFLNNEAATLNGITIDGGATGISIANNTGTTNLSAINVSNVTGDALVFGNNTGVINVVDLTATNTGDDAVVITGGGSFNFAGTTTINGLGAGATSDGFDLTGTSNAIVNTTDVDITGLGGGTGLNLAGGDATVTMTSLDVTGTGVAGSRGIDISGTQNGRTVTITNGGNISNVATGIVLGTNGAAGTAADAAFTFGGGTVAGNVFALDGVGILSGTGTYGFGTTTFTGAFNFDVSSTQNFYVAATATGTGDGSSTANRASIATAIAAAGGLGSVNFILINDGSAIDTAGLTFALGNGQSVDTFGNGRTFAEAGFVIPLNITGDNLPTGGVTVTDPTGLGAATLTNSTGAVATLSLANGNAVRNITVGSSAGSAISGSGSAGVSITGVTATAGIQLTGTTGSVTLTDVSISNGSDTGLSLSGNSGTVTGTNVDIAGVNTLAVTGGNATISFDATSSVTNTSGTAVSVSGRIGGSFSHFGTIASNGAGAGGITVSGATAASNVTFGGQVSLGTTTALGGGIGVNVDNNGQASTVAFTGGLDIATNGFAGLAATGGGSLQVTGGSISATGGSAATVSGISTTATFSSLSSSGAAGDGLALALATGSSFTVTGATTLSGMGGDGIDLSGSTGGSFTFGDVDVTGLGSGTGLNLAGGDATVTMASLDVTGTGVAGSRGIDISGTQNGRTIAITNGGTIANVATGVVLGTNGAAGAAPSANFTFGGGSISGNSFALDGIGVNAGDGTYAFGSTSFAGGFNFAVNLSSNYYIAATATGTGDGSSTANRASIATAIAAAGGLGTVNFILINDGSAIDTAGLTFALAAGQTIDTFGNGRSFVESGFIVPINVTGTNMPASGVTVTDPTGLGAATLTNSTGAVATLSLANGNAIRNITIGSSAGSAISGTGIAGVTISGVTSTSTVALTNTTGAVTLTNFSISNSAGTALSLSGNSGTVTGTNVDIAGVNTLAVTGGNATISFDATSSVTNTSGTAVSVTGRIGGSFSHFGTIASNGAGAGGITVSGATAASNVTFGGQVSLGTTTALGGGVGVNVDNNGQASTVAFTGGLDIATSGVAGLAATGGGTLRIANAGTERIAATGAAALSVTGMTVDVAFDRIDATNANITSVLLQNLDGSFAVNGGTLATVASGSSFNSFNVIQNDGSATRALTLAIDNLTITHDASGTNSTPSEHGIVVTTSGDDSAVVAISNSTFRTEDSAVRVIGNNSLATVTNFANNTLLGDATSFNPALFNNGVTFEGVTFDADVATAGIQAVNGGTFTAGTPGQSVFHGIFFGSSLNNNSGRIDFSNYTVNADSIGLSINGGNPGLTVGIADGSITAGTVRLGNGTGVANGDITLSSLTLSQILSANQFAGSFAVTGATTITSPETFLDLGGGFYQRTATTALSAVNSSGSFSFNTLNIASTAAANHTSGGATVGIDLNGNSGTFTVSGTTTITNTVEDAIRITGTSGAISFGQTAIVNPHATPIVSGTFIGGSGTPEARSAGIDISGTIGGTISFADLDITLNSANSTGIELTGATLNAAVTAEDFDLTGNSSAGTVGVDLRGVLGGGTVRLGDAAAGGQSSSIAGVQTGVFLDNTSNANFTFGDGENATDTGSTISATTAIDTTSAPTLGTYNFRDIAFAGSPGAGFGLGTIYFVDSDGAVGGGDGSGSDASNPMTLAAAELAAGANDIIVLINNGSAISAAGSNGNDTLVLANGLQLLSFGDGAGGSQAITVNLTVPSTILLSAPGITIADPTGTGGAATLTTSAGNDVVTLGASGNRLSGLILEGNGTASRGVNDSGGATGTTITRSIVRNFATQGIEITPSTDTTIDGVTFSGNAGDILLNAANSTLRNITSSGAGANGSITLTNVTGTTTLENISITGAARGISFNNAAGTVTATNVDIAGGNALAITGGNAAYNFDATSSINNTSGTAVTLQNIAGGSLTHAGNVASNGAGAGGIASSNATGGHSVSFTGAVDLGTTTALGGSALVVDNNGQAGTFSFADLDIVTNGGLGVTFQIGGTLGITTGSVSVNSAQGIELSGTAIAAGGINLTSLSNTNVAGAAGIRLNGVTGGAFTVSGTTTVSGTPGSAVSLANVASNVGLGTVNISVAGGNGLLLNGNSGTLTTGDMTIAMGGGAGNGIDATGNNGAMTFGNVDITGLGTGTGLDLSGGAFDGQITFATLDIAGTGQAGSRGINLNNYDNTQNVVTTGSGTIQGVQFGIDLTNSNIANGVRFQYGDGSAPVGSTIDIGAVAGNVAIVTTGVTATGEYDFEDLAFASSNISNLQGASFFVVDTNATSGAGTFSDPGTIAQAQASGADVIVLVDATTGGVRQIIDLGGSSFNLAAGQALLGMAANDSVDVTTLGISAGGAPASILLTGISSSSTITAPGTIDTVVPILTSSAGGGTVTLAGTATIQNVFITNSGSGDGISASFGAASTATIRSSTIGGGTGAYGIDLATTSGGSTATLSNLVLTSGLRLDGSGGGSLTGTMTGTNTIDGASGAGLQLTNASGTFGNITFGATSAIGGTGIHIVNSDGTARTVALSDITMGSGGNGDTGDVAGIGLDIDSSGTGVLTVNLTGTNVIRSTSQAMTVNETGAGTANNLLLTVNNTTFESVAAGVPSVAVTGQNVTTTTSSIGVRGFAGNTVIGNGTGGGILFTAVDFDGNGAGGAVAGGTLNVGQGTGNRVQGDGLSLIDTTGELGFTTLNIFNNGGTGLEVDTKTNGNNTVFTLNGGGSGTVDTTGGAALFLDPLTMNLTFGTVSSTGSGGSGVFVDGGNATAPGNNALTIGTLNVTGSTNAGLRITNSIGTFSLGATVINNAGSAGGGVDIDVTNGNTLNVNFTGNLDIDTGAGTGLDVQSSGGSTVTLQTAAASTTTINTATGRIVNAENLLAGASGINFDTLATSGTVTGHAVSLDLDAGTFSGGNLTVAGTTGGHGALIGGSGGTVNFASATISNVGGSFYGISTQHAGTVTFTTVAISNGRSGVYTNGNGSLNINGGSINVTGTDANDRGVWIDGGNGTINIAADVTRGGLGNAVYVVSRTGSGTATFSGDVTFTGGGATGITVENNTGGTITFSGNNTLATGTNTAVSLTNNTGSTIAFTNGGLDIDTTSGAGFVATGGGTVSVTGTGNSVTTTTGRAVQIDGTTLGAAGVTFQSISTNGATNAINLRNTGSSGFFSITGTGSTDGSGGLIQNITGADMPDEVPTASGQGAAIYLENVTDVRIANLQVQNTSNFGLRGFGVNGITMNNVDFTGSHGNNAGADEGVFYVNNLTGTATFTGGTYLGGIEDSIHIDNDGTTGTLTLAISGMSITTGDGSNAALGNNGITIQASAGNVNGTISGNSFVAATASHLQLVSSGTANYGLTIDNNTFTRHSGIVGNGGIGILAGTQSSGLFNVTISNNNMAALGSLNNAIDVGSVNGSGTFAGTVDMTISGNTIGSLGNNGSGTAFTAISVDGDGGGSSIYRITGNQIFDHNERGIWVRAGEGAGTSHQMSVLIDNNTVQDTVTGFEFDGIIVDSGVTSGPTPTICATITNNTVTGTHYAGHGIRVRARNNGSLQIANGTGGAATEVAVETHLGGAAGNTVAQTIDAVLSGTGTLSFVAACPN